MKRLLKAITTINLTRIIAFILFIILWARGDISGMFAWFLLLFLVDVTIDFRKL